MSIGFRRPLIVIKFKKEGDGINYELWTMNMSIKGVLLSFQNLYLECRITFSLSYQPVFSLDFVLGVWLGTVQGIFRRHK